jgi:glycosyltransferase involved in cell wall biosynthesis
MSGIFLESPASDAEKAHSSAISSIPSDSIALEIVGLQPSVQEKRQTDFSMLSGEIGLEWAEVLGHRLIPSARIPAFTLFRFRQGEYGARTMPDGSIHTGGLQQEMERMDMALAKLFPVTIHVAYITSVPQESYQLKDPDWRGSITVHPIMLASLNTRENATRVQEILKQVKPDLVHIVDPRNDLDRAIIEGLPDHIGIVASNHSAPAQSTRMSGEHKNYLKKFIERYREYRQIGGALDSLKLVVADSIQFLNRRLHNSNIATEKVNSEALRHGHGAYQAHNLSTVSEAGRGNLKSHPSIVMHPPVDAEFFSPDQVSAELRVMIRHSLGLSDDRLLLLYHARICALKGQAYLPQVIAEARKMTDRPIAMVIVGPETEAGALERLRHEIKRFDQRDSFLILGGRSQVDIRNLLGATDLGLFPSFLEGLGLTAVEMQLMRVPVIAHRVGGIPEAVKHGVTGSLVTPGDITGFASEICRLVESPQLRSEYGNFGRKLMMQEFNPTVVATRALESLYLPQVLNLGRAAI